MQPDRVACPQHTPSAPQPAPLAHLPIELPVLGSASHTSSPGQTSPEAPVPATPTHLPGWAPAAKGTCSLQAASTTHVRHLPISYHTAPEGLCSIPASSSHSPEGAAAPTTVPSSLTPTLHSPGEASSPARKSDAARGSWETPGQCEAGAGLAGGGPEVGLSKGTQGLAEASSKAVGQWCTGPLQASQLGQTGKGLGPRSPASSPIRRPAVGVGGRQGGRGSARPPQAAQKPEPSGSCCQKRRKCSGRAAGGTDGRQRWKQLPVQ